jgi:hypothetical protein
MRQIRIACHKCRHAWSFEPPMGRRDECPRCHVDVRVCLNCRHYDPGAHHECREEQAEWVKDKASGNFCSYFEGSDAEGRRPGDVAGAKVQLDQLFAKGPAAAEARPAPSAALADQLRRFLDAKK